MKCTIRKGVEGVHIVDMVPPSYRDLIRKQVQLDQAYTLLLFAHTSRDVVTSRPVRQALRRLDGTPSGRVLAVGTTFTAEAKALIQAHEGIIIEQRSTEWTDASAALRQL